MQNLLDYRTIILYSKVLQHKIEIKCHLNMIPFQLMTRTDFTCYPLLAVK